MKMYKYIEKANRNLRILQQGQEYRIWCGNYRHFIINANSIDEARNKFIQAYKENPLNTNGFNNKDITKIKEV